MLWSGAGDDLTGDAETGSVLRTLASLLPYPCTTLNLFYV
jgi:hypothetical protein